jgi:hypothetical protein
MQPEGKIKKRLHKSKWETLAHFYRGRSENESKHHVAIGYIHINQSELPTDITLQPNCSPKIPVSNFNPKISFEKNC